MSININPKKITELLDRGVDEVIERKHLEVQLRSGKTLRVKFGIDPTYPHMHLGHTIPLRKLRQFQDMGHQAVLIIGDATAMIGDPTGRSVARQKLTEEEVQENQKTYLAQAAKILNLDTLEVRHNGEWFFSMSARETLELASLVTVQQVLQREDFRKRASDEENPLSALEMMYPMMQGYDSVMIKADVELGGIDQKLNLLMGRRIQRKFDMPEQDVMTVPLLVGTDGERKMSKTYDNAIFLEDSAEEIFAKVMSVPDSLIIHYFTLLTRVSDDDIRAISQSLVMEDLNPRDVKARLGTEIVKEFYSKEAADGASTRFDQLFKEHEVPDDIPEFKIDGTKSIVDILVETKLVPSKSEARRLIGGGGVKVNGEVVSDTTQIIEPTAGGVLIQKGKRYFVRIVG